MNFAVSAAILLTAEPYGGHIRTQEIYKAKKVETDKTTPFSQVHF